MELTPNQLVAYNLARLRRERGLTQEQAAELLEPHLGARWSKAAFSQVEQSVLGKRHREFTADDLVAFARAFEVPLAWFFLPPDVGDLGVRRDDQPPDLLDFLFGSGQRFDALWRRLLKLIQESPPKLRVKRQAAIGAWMGQRFGVNLTATLGTDVEELARNLTRLVAALLAAKDQTHEQEIASREYRAQPTKPLREPARKKTRRRR